jgi:hypothetical protein
LRAPAALAAVALSGKLDPRGSRLRRGLPPLTLLATLPAVLPALWSAGASPLSLLVLE